MTLEETKQKYQTPDGYLQSEELRLARLKIFCDGMGLSDYAANEEICRVCNDAMCEGYYEDPEEIQKRYIAVKSYDLKIPLDCRYFWDLFHLSI